MTAVIICSSCEKDPAIVACEKFMTDARTKKIDLTKPTYEGTVSMWETTFAGQGVRLPTGEWGVFVETNGKQYAMVLAEEGGDQVTWTLSKQELPHHKLVAAFGTSLAKVDCEQATDPTVQANLTLVSSLLTDINPDVVAAHHDVQGAGELAQLTHSKSEKKWGWHVWMPSPEGYLQLSYFSADEDRIRAIAAQGVLGSGQVKGPSLLQSIALAAKSPSDESWSALKRDGLPQP